MMDALYEAITRNIKENNSDELLNLLMGTNLYGSVIKEAASLNNTFIVQSIFSALKIPEDNRAYTDAQIILLNYALQGYTTARNFAEVKKLVNKGANIFHGLNELATQGALEKNDGKALLDCVEGETHAKLKDQMELVYGFNFDITNNSSQGLAF